MLAVGNHLTGEAVINKTCLNASRNAIRVDSYNALHTRIMMSHKRIAVVCRKDSHIIIGIGMSNCHNETHILPCSANLKSALNLGSNTYALHEGIFFFDPAKSLCRGL